MKEYVEKYRDRIILMGVFVFLIHGAKLHSAVIGIDTEDIIHIQGDFYGGWLNTGRQGLTALKWLTDSWSFRPFMAGLLTLLFFGLAVSAFFLLWDRIKPDNFGKSVIPWAVGGLFVIAHPIITEQFYFTLQSAEICIGVGFTAAALYLVTRYGESGGMWRPAVSVLLLLLTFSVYQSLVTLFIFGTVSVLLLEGLSKLQDGLQSGEDVPAGKLLKKIVPYLVVFLTAFGINALITRLFFSTSDYLEGQILWGKFAVMDNLRAIAGHIVKALTGYRSVHYHFSFGVLCILTLGLVITVMSGAKGKHGGKPKCGGAKAVVLFYLAALFLTPFLMTFVCGGSPAIRSQLVLPFLTGFLAYLDVGLLLGRKSAKESGASLCRMTAGGAILLCIVGIYAQTATTMSLYYTDRMRYEQDAALGRELITEIDRAAGGEELPVAVIGTRPFAGNHACVVGEIIGKSFFDHDAEVEPQYYWSTRRALGFLHTLGADYPQAGMDRFAEAVQNGANMPVWPQEGSVRVQDGMVLVKLGEAEGSDETAERGMKNE